MIYDEMLGAYALDALDADERRAVDEYLAVNPRAAAEVRDHLEVASMLSFSTMKAPDDLWGRIAAEIGADDSPVEPLPIPQGELANLMPLRAVHRHRRVTSVLPWALASAAAVALVVVSLAAFPRQNAPTDPLVAGFQQATSDRDSRVATLAAEGSDISVEAVVDADGHGYIDGSSLPPLDESQAYQLWGVIDDKVISLGVFGAKPEIEPFSAEANVVALAVTIEVASGVVSNGNPEGMYVGELSL
jgi:anti-sigma-K factor RskA